MTEFNHCAFRASLYKMLDDIDYSKLEWMNRPEANKHLEKCIRDWMCEQLDGICDEDVMWVVKLGGEAILDIRRVRGY